MIENLEKKNFGIEEKVMIRENRTIPLGDFQVKNGSKDYWKDLPLVLHVKDLSTLLSVSHNTAYELVRSGRIRSIRVGRNYRIPRDAVEEYLCRC
jgi:excisionase family DNA binding protein